MAFCLRMAAPITYTDEQAAQELRQNPGVIQSSPDPTEATAETVEYMCQLIHDSLADGIVQRATVDADRFRQFAAAPWASIWWWVKHQVKFVHHQRLLVEWLGAPDELQLLIRPDALLKMSEPKGDCAVFTTLVCAMLDCCGLAWEIVTVAVDPRQPGIYSHVYPRVILGDGRRIPLDSSHGKYPGWEVPAEAMSAKQVWGMDGNPVEDVAARQFQGLHGVDMRYMYGGADRRGLGQDDSDSGDDGSSDPVVLTGLTDTLDPTTDIGSGYTLFVPVDTSSGGVSPSGGSSGGSGITSSGGSGGSTIAQDIQALLTGGNTVARTALGLPATGTTQINTNTLLLIGAGTIGIILLVSLMSGGRK